MRVMTLLMGFALNLCGKLEMLLLLQRMTRTALCSTLTPSFPTSQKHYFWPLLSFRACEWSVSGRFAALRSSLFLWHPLSAPRPPAPRSAPTEAFSGMSAHCSAPSRPVFCPLRSALTCAERHLRIWYFVEHFSK